MLIYTSSSPTKSQIDEFLKTLGLKNGYDQIPWPLPNMQKIKEEEYWHWVMSYTPKLNVWVGQISITGQPWLKKQENPSSSGDRWGTVRLYFVNHGNLTGGGFAVIHEYWEKKVYYFQWTDCTHEWQAKTIGNCLNRYTCKNCHRYHDVDSSD